MPVAETQPGPPSAPLPGAPTPEPAPESTRAPAAEVTPPAPEVAPAPPTPAPPTPAPPTAVSAAAALLERLRAEDTGQPEAAPIAAPAPAPATVAEPAPVRAEPTPEQDGLLDTVMPVAAQRRDTAAELVAIAGGPVSMVAPDGRVVEIDVVDGQSAGDLAAAAAKSLGLATYDLAGRRERTWSISGIFQGQGAAGLTGKLALVSVDNTVHIREVQVDTNPPLRFRAPIGRGMPVHAVLAHLAAWLELTGDLRLEVANRVASADDLIGECGSGVLTVLLDPR